MLTPNLVLLNGSIYTISGSREGAVAIKDDKIVAVGNTEQIKKMASKDTEIIDLQGKAVFPGFIDAHTHLVRTGLERTLYLNLIKIKSLKELLELVREEAKSKAPGEWIIGRGWDESRWPEKRYVTRTDLDKVAPKNPVVLIRIDGHLFSVNSKALAEVKVPKNPEEFNADAGILREETAWRFYEQIEPGLDKIKEAIREAAKLACSLGVTSIHDIVSPNYIRAYSELKGELEIRVYLNIKADYLEKLMDLGFSTGFGNEWLRLGAIKIFADGSLGAGNAALYEPYADRQSKGKLNYNDKELSELIRLACENNFQVMIHAIGDRAIDSALNAFAKNNIDKEERYRIEHFELASEAQIERAYKIGIIASMQPNFLQWDLTGGLYEARLGKERASRICPYKKVIEKGVILAFGSDCMPLAPLLGIHCAVNAPYELQRLSVEEAIRCYTLNSAYAAFEEDIKGSIEEGKLADLVVLSEDPYKFPDRIKDIKVEATYLGGRKVFPVL